MSSAGLGEHPGGVEATLTYETMDLDDNGDCMMHNNAQRTYIWHCKCIVCRRTNCKVHTIIMQVGMYIVYYVLDVYSIIREI